MEVDGVGSGRDYKLYPGGGREWDWKETDTHHVPGIQPADVEELFDHGSKVIVLSRGMQLALQTAPETCELLQERGVPYHIRKPTRPWNFTTAWPRRAIPSAGYSIPPADQSLPKACSEFTAAVGGGRSSALLTQFTRRGGPLTSDL